VLRIVTIKVADVCENVNSLYRISFTLSGERRGRFHQETQRFSLRKTKCTGTSNKETACCTMTPLSVIIFFLFAVVWPHASSLQQSARNRRAFIGSAAALIGGTNFVTFESADALISSKYWYVSTIYSTRADIAKNANSLYSSVLLGSVMAVMTYQKETN
jgi:hypothetical protein